MRGIKWKLAQDDLRDLGSRLEGNKSTLLLLLASIRFVHLREQIVGFTL